ncbi:MAG: [LysW]-lysine hydrolase [Anaerolineae bacterium]|jgi:LysW-gamma-L-lysine carboxypeptidase|nr:[LysW]-lysine hydrolase [Anaerolineae bacterium]
MDEISFLEQLVSIPSPSGGEDAIGEYLVEQMLARGFCAYRDEVGNAIGVIGNPKAEREIMLLGHMDTVPPNLPVHQQENLLYGRGTVDAKGALAAFVLAATRAAPKLNDACVVVVGAVEEEDPRGKGAHHLLETMRPPDCVVVGEPSTWEGVTLGYKGILSVDYRWMQAGGHSAGQIPGPAEKAVKFWNRVMNYAETYNHGQEGHFSTLDPALRDFHTVNDGTDEGVEMNIVLRLPPRVDIADLKQRLLDWGGGAVLSFSGHEPPYQSDKNTPPVRALLQAIRAEGGRPRFKLKTGTSDMNVVGAAWNCPMVAYGPGDSALDHTPEEHIDVREFKRSVNVLARALEILARKT